MEATRREEGLSFETCQLTSTASSPRRIETRVATTGLELVDTIVTSMHHALATDRRSLGIHEQLQEDAFQTSFGTYCIICCDNLM